MRRQKKVSHQFLKLSQEHVIVGQHIESLQEAVKSAPSNEILIPMLESFSQDLAEHFALEEEVLFPAALMGIRSLDICDAVLTFSKEHGYFERDLESIRNAISEAPLQETVDETVGAGIQALLDSMRHHARHETQDLFAVMDASRECTKILKGFLIV